MIPRTICVRTAIAVLAVLCPLGYSAPRRNDLRLSSTATSDNTDQRHGRSFLEAKADLLQLESEADRAAFRQWFTFIAEAQYFRTAALPREVNDCAGLLRFAYREALREHSDAWAAQMALPLIPAITDIRQYHYPGTPVGASLFRIRPTTAGPELEQSAFAEFADAETLRRFNTRFISRDIYAAQSGDLLFFRQLNESATYHAMIFVGRSQIEPSEESYIVYHTGPTGHRPGEIRRLSVRDLLAYPDARWHPDRDNRAFLGVYRWNILSGAD